METTGNQSASEMEAAKLSEDSLLTGVCWDKRMRLNISKDFSKERTRMCTEGRVARDDRPAQRRFSCTVCQKVFPYAADCLSHIHTHHEEPTDCLSQPSTHTGKQQVYDSPHGDLLHCEQTENVGGDESENVTDVDDSESMNCGHSDGEESADSSTHCSAVFSSDDDLKKRLNQTHTDLDTRKMHERNVSGRTPKNIRVCKQRFSEVKPEEEIYIIRSLESFSAKKRLAKRERSHKEHPPFTCDVDDCDIAFPDRASFSRHQRMHRKERPHVCPHCKKAFKARSHLREHVRIHTGEKPFVCELCGARFTQSNGLKSHAKQHSLERVNQCEICHKAFSRPHILQTHRKTHSGERPFSCNQCHQTFLTAANLASHKRLKHDTVTGNGEKHFICDVCGASFSQACNLGIHKKMKHSTDVMSRVKTFFCDICDASFLEACNLGAHKKMKHAEQSEDGRTLCACDICGAKFYRESNLAAHKRRKHPDTCEN